MSQINPTQQRVCIVGEGSMFDEGVSLLLQRDTNLRVSRAMYSDDLAFLKTIEWDQPDVMLVCESDSLHTERLLSLVSLQPVMLLLIVIVRLSNNVIDVYAKPTNIHGELSHRPQSIVARNGRDLLNVLRRNHYEQ